MIKVEHLETFNWEGALRGMRNPLASHAKADSSFDPLVIGPRDLALMQRLYNAGSEHCKYLRQIFVCMDITAPLYWWKEMDQYRIGVTTDSFSTMHRIMAKPFEMNDFSFDMLVGYKNEVKQFKPVVDEDMEETEVWKEYDKDYDVSNYGRIKHKFQHHSRIISGSLHQDGYIFVTLHGKQIPLHVVIAKVFLKDTFVEGLVVNHKDGNKQNNCVDNLEWVTVQQNAVHVHENHLSPQGLGSYKRKLTAEQRQEIKDLWDNSGKSRREIATMFGVSHTTICSIINDKYKYADKVNIFEEMARPIIDSLNELRDSYLSCTDEESQKKIWYMVIQLLPSSYNQTRTTSMSYANVMNILNQRQYHKLHEWVSYCEALQNELPYIKAIRGEE